MGKPKKGGTNRGKKLADRKAQSRGSTRRKRYAAMAASGEKGGKEIAKTGSGKKKKVNAPEGHIVVVDRYGLPIRGL